MSKKLKASVGDKISAFFIINGKPKQRNYYISGIYETGLDKIDDQFGFIDIKQLTKLKIYSGDNHPHSSQNPMKIDLSKLNNKNIIRN